MGGSLEKALFDGQVSWMPTEDPTFVIPSSVKLSPAQLEILGAQNIRPGAAFSLTNENTIVPPNSKKFKLKMIKSFVSILSESVSLTEISRGMFSVGFTYSSTMALSCTINFNVRDNTTSSKLDIKQSLISWGPFQLSAGINVAWSTSSLPDSYAVDYTKLPIYVHFGKPSANYYDVVISFEPMKNSWVPSGALTAVTQFNTKPAAGPCTNKKTAGSLYARSFMFSHRNKVGLENPSPGFNVPVNAVGETSSQSTLSAPVESAIPDNQRFASEEFPIFSNKTATVSSTGSPNSSTTAPSETSHSGTIIQSVVYYYRLPYFSGGRYLDAGPSAGSNSNSSSAAAFDPLSLGKTNSNFKKLPPAGQRGVNVFPLFNKSNRAVVIPQSDPDEVSQPASVRGQDGSVEGHYQPLEDHEIEGVVSRFMQEFSSDESGDDNDHHRHRSRSSASRQRAADAEKGRRGSNGAGAARTGPSVDSIDGMREDYSMYESPAKPQILGGTGTMPPLKSSTESPAREGKAAETSVTARMEIRPFDAPTAMAAVAPLTVQSVGSSAALSLASERSGGGVSSSGRPARGGNFSPDASGTSYDFSAGGGTDSPAMFNRATFVSAIKSDAGASVPGGGGKARAKSVSAVSSAAAGASEMFTSAPITAQCVHLRFKTLGGVYNAMPMFGMESYYGKAAASPPSRAEGSSEGAAAPPAAAAAVPSSDIDPDDCIICLENPRDTAMFPCRHLCVCSSCAAMSMSSESKCPMCRNSVTIMLQFKKRRTVNV